MKQSTGPNPTASCFNFIYLGLKTLMDVIVDGSMNIKHTLFFIVDLKE